MKKLIAITVTLLMILATATMAEMNVPFSEWLEAFGASAEQAVVQDEPLVAEGVPLVPFTPIGVGSRGDDVVQIQEKLIELGFLAGKADGIFGAGTEAAVKMMQKALGWEETGVIASVDELNTVIGIEPGDGVNLAVGTSNEWSEWMMPAFDQENRCFNVAYAYLGEKKIGDPITCQLEIEFYGVSSSIDDGERAFVFYSQGAVDGKWEGNNIWNPSLIRFDTIPTDGVYKYSTTCFITENNVSSTQFNIGFRCDYWAGGQFRVRNIKVEKGITATSWTPAPLDVGNGVNLVVGTNDEWSEWITPKANTNNVAFSVASVDLPDKVVGEPFTCQFEVEFMDVAKGNGDSEAFAFKTQGAVDGAWEGTRNIWTWEFVSLDEPPANGVYKYTTTARIVDMNVNSIHFELGFRCDYWAGGSFRVRKIKVERGLKATEWTPAA